jgi:hypothetical protein
MRDTNGALVVEPGYSGHFGRFRRLVVTDLVTGLVTAY